MADVISKVHSLFLGVVVTIAACGPLDERGHTPAPGSIRIGVLARRTPLLAAFAARTAAREINAAGGVLGRPIEIVTATDRLCDPAHAPTAFRSLLEQGAVAATVALCSAAVKEDLARVANPSASDVAIISVSSTSPELSGTPNFFRTVPTDLFQGRFLADDVFDQGLDTASIVFVDDTYGTRLSDAFVARFEQRGGRVLARVGTQHEKTTGFKAEVEALFAAGRPKAIVIVAILTGAAGLTREIAALSDPRGIRFFGSEAVVGEGFVASADASIAEGMEGLTPGADPNDPSRRAFVEAFRVATGQSIATAEESQLAGFYDGIYLLALAMERGGHATTKVIRENLAAVSGPRSSMATKIHPGEFAKAIELLRKGEAVDYDGATGPIDLDENGDPTRGSYLVWRIVQGRFVIDRTLHFP
jgi:branched-chain amino acid transport system substrate-binding protein